jgi:hypothetical protein
MPPKLQQVILSAILAKSPEYREILMIVLLDMDHGKKVNISDIAKALGLDQPRCYRRLFAAMESLRRDLQQNPEIRDWLEETDYQMNGTADNPITRLLDLDRSSHT